MVNCCKPPKYTARDLREAVTFERVTNTTDDYGARVQAWATIAEAPTRAMVKPLSSKWKAITTHPISSHTKVRQQVLAVLCATSLQWAHVPLPQ